MRTAQWSTLWRQGKRLFVWLLAVLVVLTTLSLVFLSTPYQSPPDEVDTVAAEDDLTVDRTDFGYVLEPAGSSSHVGLVFYPGGRVSPDAYVKPLAPLARDANVTVYIPDMPLNLAVVDYGMARLGVGTDAPDVAMASSPAIEEWYVGGHSLGGAMACRYATVNADIDGLVLYASYCDRDVSDRDLAVLSVVGKADTVLDWEAYERGIRHLPPTAQVEVLEGVNHTQFASYTGQDAPSGTSYDTAHERLNRIAVPWFLNRTVSERLETSNHLADLKAAGSPTVRQPDAFNSFTLLPVAVSPVR